MKNNQGKMDITKGTNKMPVTDPKEMNIYKMLGKELKITILRNFIKHQYR